MPDLIPAIGLVVAEERFDAFTKAHGGVDLRQLQELCVARYRDATLTIAKTPFDPASVARAFEAKSTTANVKTTSLAPNPPVQRLTGDAFGQPRTLTLFGRDALTLEDGAGTRSRAAEAFAFGKLHRAKPALESNVLERARALAAEIGDTPLQVFAPGPFEGESAKGLGGLLRGTTAIGVSARPLRGAPQIVVRLVLVGAWGKDAEAAAERLSAAVQLLAESPAGRLAGIDRPVAGPHVKPLADALVLDVTLDALALARGIRDAVAADVADILRQ